MLLTVSLGFSGWVTNIILIKHVRQNNDNQNVTVLDFLTLDYTKPHEPVTAISSGNVPSNEQAPVNLQLRNADIENEQSAIGNTRIQSNTVATGM